jgi:hypothetical protein
VQIDDVHFSSGLAGLLSGTTRLLLLGVGA